MWRLKLQKITSSRIHLQNLNTLKNKISITIKREKYYPNVYWKCIVGGSTQAMIHVRAATYSVPVMGKHSIQSTCPFVNTLKTSENQRFFYVFRGYRKRPVAWNKLKLALYSLIKISFPPGSTKNCHDRHFWLLCMVSKEATSKEIF